MKGKIVKSTGGFYYVDSEGEIYETRGRGNFRHKGKRPMVGDEVEFIIQDGLGYITSIFPRKNQLLRPDVANVDQVLVVIPIESPLYNLYIIDKIICHYEHAGLDILISVNKVDLNFNESVKIKEIYEKVGYRVFLTDISGRGYEELKSELENKTTALAGVSGAGKSTLTSNLLGLDILRGSVSEKTGRGKHTTRHVEIFSKDSIYIFDTPGFSSMDLSEIEPEELGDLFIEFFKYRGNCKFNNCKHRLEPGCGVIEAVESGLIPKERYENY